jgi:hypothetical protein
MISGKNKEKKQMLRKLPNGTYIDPKLIAIVKADPKEYIVIIYLFCPNGAERCEIIDCKSRDEAEKIKEEVAELANWE